jgi:hypothetical protein
MGAGECYIYVLKRSVRGGGSLDISRLPGIPGGRYHDTLVADTTIPWWQIPRYLVADTTIPGGRKHYISGQT